MAPNRASIVIGLVLTSACGGRAATPPPEPVPAGVVPLAPRPAGAPDAGASPPTAPTELQDRMRGHFAELERIERALIFGQLAPARSEAEALAAATASSEHAALPADRLAALRAEASRLAASTSVAKALPRLASLAGACAGCHTAMHFEPELPALAEPSEDGTSEGRMARHQWAAARLWEGVIAPSDAAWRAGLDVLADTPLLAEAMTDDRGRYAELERLGAALQADARTAREVGAARRPAALGAMLERCAACHALAGS